MPTKLCKTCNEIKAYELFPTQNFVKSGRGSQCKACVSARGKRRYAVKREEIVVRCREYKANNREKVLIKARAYSKIYDATNKAKRNSITRKYQASKLNRTPSWLTAEHKTTIQKYYEEANRLTIIFGVLHVVDHIVPLQGKTVSGLHVPWNLQILTAQENLAKSNNV